MAVRSGCGVGSGVRLGDHRSDRSLLDQVLRLGIAAHVDERVGRAEPDGFRPGDIGRLAQ